VIEPRDERPHEHGGRAGWSERLSFNFFDATSGFGGIARVDHRPVEKRADGTISVFMPEGAIATVFAKEPIADAGDRGRAGHASRWELRRQLAQLVALYLSVQPDPAARGVGAVDVTAGHNNLIELVGSLSPDCGPFRGRAPRPGRTKHPHADPNRECLNADRDAAHHMPSFGEGRRVAAHQAHCRGAAAPRAGDAARRRSAARQSRSPGSAGHRARATTRGRI